MKKSRSPRPMLQSVLLSQLVWLLSAAVLLSIFCTVSLSMRDPDGVIKPLSLCALYLSAIIGGMAAVRFSGDGILSGTLSGLITAAIVFALSALPLTDSSFSLPLSLILTLLIIPASAVGSILGHKRGKNPAKRRNALRKL